MMRAAPAVLVISRSTFADPGRADTTSFEREVIGIPRSDCDAWGTGDAGRGQLAVVGDDSAQGQHVLQQHRREPTKERTALAIYKPFSGTNPEVAIRFKPISGCLDHPAGVAVRLTGPEHPEFRAMPTGSMYRGPANREVESHD
jgi:hypothetical protein